MQLQSQSVINL